MQNTAQFNSLAFIMEGGAVSITVAIILLIMSVASWYFMMVKAYQAFKLRKATSDYAQAFWAAPNLQTALHIKAGDIAADRLAHQAVEAAQHHQTHAVKNLDEACSHDEFIARTMRRGIGQANAQLEVGLSVLASVGSVAPFVGLFGTVWGIYHALANISASGQASLDKVAGPVGEALIMTAIGLAVAIPAVLAYNGLVRANRLILAQLDHFAQDLHTLLITGVPLHVKKSGAHTKVAPIQATKHDTHPSREVAA